MIFRQCSIGGKVYAGDAAPLEDADTEVKAEVGNEKQDAKAVLDRMSSAESSTAAGSNGVGPNDETAVPIPPGEVSTKPPKNVLIHFSDATLKTDLEDAVSAGHNSEKAALARSLNGFFIVLALCHTVLTSINPETGTIEYKAQSPDEAALVQAAADVGFVFHGRDREILKLQTPFSEEVEKYELLNILEFTSARKRMSVVLRKLDGADERIFLLTKGADSVIFERLKAGGDELKAATEKHLGEFASGGLRTLTLAYKVIPGASPFVCYANWIERVHFVLQRASTSPGVSDITRLRLLWRIGKPRLRPFRTSWSMIYDCWELLRLRIVCRMAYRRPLLTSREPASRSGWLLATSLRPQ